MGILQEIKQMLGLVPPDPPTPRPEVVTVRVTSSANPPEGYVSPYLPSDLWDELLVLDADGMPPLRFVEHNGATWMAERTTGRLVNVKNGHLRRLGIWSTRIRGGQYQTTAAKVGPAELVREPDNSHDPNAVAVHVDGQRVGYFNQVKARGLAKVLDAGTVLEAVIVSVDPPKVVAASPEVIAHLRS